MAFKAFKIKKDKQGNEILYCDPSGNYQEYKENETVEIPGTPICCENGVHACDNPLDVLNYHDLTECVFAKVEALGEKSYKPEDTDTKFATNKIKIGARLDLKGFIKASFDFLWEKCSIEKSTGNFDQLASSGDGAKLASSGYGAKLASSGDGAKLASSGDGAKLASSGYGAKLASSGDGAQLELKGVDNVGANIGIGGTVKGKIGNWITLAEWNWTGDKYVPICVKSAQIDGEKLRENVFYKLIDGEFTEV